MHKISKGGLSTQGAPIGVPSRQPHRHGLLPLTRLLLLLGLVGQSSRAAIPPTEAWLRYHAFEAWESVLDHDGDGFSAEDEFAYGTDPLHNQSHPPRFVPGPDGLSFQIQIAAGVAYGSADLQTSTDLVAWMEVPGFPPAAPGTFTLAVQPEESARFFRFAAPVLANSDGDCLLDFEELNLFQTDPLKSDTDGDGLDDCAELLVHHTDPNRGSTGGRGALRGQVVLDEDKDPLTRDHPGIPGWTVFVDLDFDGEWDETEPSATSQPDGNYRITELDPGFYRVCLARQPVWTQVFPALTPVPIPDGYPDRVVEVFDSGTGPIPFPYGRYPDPLPGVRLVFPSPPPDPVEASVVLGALPPPPIGGPFGGWAHVDILSIPTNSFVTVAFEGEEIFDGPGPDLAIWCAGSAAQDSAEVWLGPTSTNLMRVGAFTQLETIPIDLAEVSVPGPVRSVKIRGLGLTGTYPGFDMVGVEGLHYRARSRGHYEVTIVEGQTVDGIDFGVAGDDRPPKVSIATHPWDIRAGQTVTVGVTATDDVGVTSVGLTANGVEVALDAQRQAVVPVVTGGLFTLRASATDTSGQQAGTLTSLIARNEDGSLPDLSGLGARGGSVEGGPSIQVLSPVAGEILNDRRGVIGTVVDTAHGVARWQVHYAPAAAVNPEALDAPDPDYVLAGEGTGTVVQAKLGELPGETLPAGAYLVRILAADSQGTTRYLGFVVGVRVEPLDIRPEIVLTAPQNEAMVTQPTEVRGSVQSRETLREWLVEYAPLAQVNLQQLSDPTPVWTLLARGTNEMTNAVLARFDPTRVPNDAYVLRVSAWNRNGLGWAEPRVVHVTGASKPGEFAVEFTDVQLPLAGIGITVKRVYRSLDAARVRDFGHGWSLALQEADIAETVPQTGRGFGSTPFRVGTRVYLTAPDGQRLGFTLQPEVGALSFLGAAYRAVFKPDPGVRYTLEVPEGDSAFLSVRENGDLALFFIPLPWNPDTYVLSDPAGTQYTYDQDDGLIEIQDPHGNRVSFTEAAITHSAGPEIRLTRDNAGRMTRIVAPNGQTWRYEYDAGGDLVRVTYPGDLVATYGYAASRPHLLETINDPWRGPVERAEYDADGRVVAIVDAQGQRRTQSWDPDAFTGTYTDARGNVTRLVYNNRGNPTRREDPLGGVTTWEYKDANHPDLATTVTDPLGNRTTYQFDARGNLVRRETPAARTSFTYDEGNRVTRIVHGTGGAETFEYDAAGNLTRRSSQRGERSFTGTAHGLLASMQDGEGGLTRFEYDGAGSRPSRIILPDGGVRQFAYDGYGRIVAHTDPLGAVTRYEYDAAGRLAREIDPSGAERRTVYDGAFPDQPATVTDRAGRVTRFAYDPAGRLEQFVAPGGAITRFEYDADGNRTAIVDPLGNRYEFVYDAMNRLVEETDPRGKTRRHRYDLAGNRLETIDRNGRRRAFVHDASRRLTEERWLDPGNDTPVRIIKYSHDRVDNLASVSDPDAEIRLGYLVVPGGPLVSEEARYVGAPVRRFAASLDSAGRRSGVGLTTISPRLEPALAVDYTRDLAGRLRIITGRDPLPPSTLRGLAFQLQLWRNARGDITELRRFSDGNGAREIGRSSIRYSADCGCQVEQIEHVIATNQPWPEATLKLSRLPDGTLTGMEEGTNVLAFTHDAAGQLTGVTSNGTARESYTYDANGNRTASHRHAGYRLAPANRVVQAGPWMLEYDDEGNLLTKSNGVTGVSLAFTWDHRNRLTQVRLADPAGSPAETATEYRYDGLNRRIAVIRDGQTTWTYYDGLQPLVDFLGDETTPLAIHYGGERLDEWHAFWRRGEGLFWALTDHLGTPRRVLDTNGVEVAVLQFDSFGNASAATGSHPAAAGRFAFAGRERDALTGLHHLRQREYDPDTGRFLSEDPIGFAGGDLNLYRYVRNRPLSATDPLGLSESTESGILQVPSQLAKEAICEAGAEVASVYISAAVEVPSAYVSAAVDVASGAACGARGGPVRAKPRPLTPEEIRLNDLLELPPPAPRNLDDDIQDLWLDAMMGDQKAKDILDSLWDAAWPKPPL